MRYVGDTIFMITDKTFFFHFALPVKKEKMTLVTVALKADYRDTLKFLALFFL